MSHPSSLIFCRPQGWEDDVGKMSLYRFSRLRDVNQPKVLTERGKHCSVSYRFLDR